MPPRAGSPIAALANQPYRMLFFGTIAMQMGFGMMAVVQGIVAFDLTGLNSTVGLVSFGAGATQVVLGPIGGALTDRLPKRTLLIFGQTVVGAAFAATGILVLTDAITVLLLVLGTVSMGSVFAIIGPTRQAWVGELLHGPLRSNGMALQQMAQNVARIGGPFVVGALVAVPHVGAGGAYLVMAGLFALSIVFALRMPRGAPAQASGRSIMGEVRLGLGYIWTTPELRLLVGTFTAMIVMSMSYQTIMPGFLENELERPSRDLGLCFGVAALGAIASTVAIASRRTPGGQRLLLAMGVGTAASLAALACSPGLVEALLALFAVGAFTAGFQLVNNVAVMERCAPEYYGRVTALIVMSFGLMGVAAYPIGALADAAGERTLMLACALGVVAVVTLSGLGASRIRLAPRPVVVD